MKKLLILLFLFSVVSVVWAQESKLKSDAQSGFAKFDLKCNVDLADENLGFDVRCCDLSNKDLSGLNEQIILKYITFDDKTIWPKGGKMPKWLNPQRIMQTGKTPGLNIRELHGKGITGKGVSIAIIDQSLGKHAEYQDRLRFYKDMAKSGSWASMHGAAVASIALGKTVGVAPEADLYYISSRFEEGEDGKFNAGPEADAIKEILEINKSLPSGQKIAVISISRGFNDSDSNRKEYLDVIKKAKEQNIAVLTSKNVVSISRGGYDADTDKRSAYTLLSDWIWEYGGINNFNSRIWTPAGYRIIASPTGYNDFVAYGGAGSSSWAVPYYAGLYALAKQVYPALTADVFEEAVRATSSTAKIKSVSGDKEGEVKYFINPTTLIEYFQKKAGANKAKTKDMHNKMINDINSSLKQKMQELTD